MTRSTSSVTPPTATTPTRRVIPVLLACVALIAALAGCSTGSDAVASGGTFEFVSPGGKTDIVYDPPAARGTIGSLAGPDLMTAGKTTSVEDYAGKVVVLNLWGQWCGPCRAEAPALEKVHEATKDKGVAYLGINVRDPQQDKAQDFVVDNKVGYPSIYDPSMRTLLALGGNFPTSVIPTTLVLDRQHRVAAVFLRSLLADDLQPVVERLAAEESQ
ncbi:TlpA family protein disulfide reductase [Nocardia sp. NBC_00881]|uniref:TlpA disulfide reductase family protein n=1 Tax=Nocardia sp. NBC_00881 TaxID=2975995 RepID=UPI00386667C8|nr:TlpA family protein disulfide reductase [Nocardia sp. NBC_00881]